MIRADDNARAFFRRRLLPQVHFQQLERVDYIEYGESLEVQVDPKDISEAVLSLIFHFLISAENGRVYHFSTGDNLYYSLLQSGLDLSGSLAARADAEGRLQAGCVYSCQRLAEIFKFLSSEVPSSSGAKCKPTAPGTDGTGCTTPGSYEPTLVILEALSPVLIAEKVK